MPRRDPELTEAARKLVKKTRAAQGLPPKLSDPVVIDRVARLTQFWKYSQTPEGSRDEGFPGK